MSLPRLTATTRCRAIAPALLAALVAVEGWCAPAQSDPDAAAASIRRADAHYAQSDFAAAQEAYAEALRLVELEQGSAAAALVEPLAGLARTRTAMRQFGDAIEPLTRAVTILRRSAGLYDARQFVLLSQLVDLHSLLGDLSAAESNLAFMERLSASNDGRHSVQHARFLADVAAWHCRLGRFDSGRERYRRSIRRLESHSDAELLIAPLLGLARCSLEELAAEGIATSSDSIERYRGPVLRTQRLSVDSPAFHMRVLKALRMDGEQALRRAAHLAETTSLRDEQRVLVLLQVGDWFQAKDHDRTARKYYARAQTWARRTIAAEDPFAAPVQVLYPVPPLALRNRAAGAATTSERFVEIEFTVRADGRVDHERIVVRDAGKSAADETLQAVQVARYRPRVVDGKSVETTGVRLRQAFR
jgi:tetratricopeptide (TPR) repeat protein